jgi:hypothetical protein
MENEREILGYVICHDCMTPKAIMQGSGKRANYVYGRCECGPDNRTKPTAQKVMKAYKPLADVQAQIESLNQPVISEPEPVDVEEKETSPEISTQLSESVGTKESDSEPETNPLLKWLIIPVVAGAAIGIGKAIKAVKAVA